ncbi:hypothetical protein CIPAW_06G020000 [Carya illinoinensis]|uniref:Uncharacterized protein n=1 Tax=Carya illinoinensis TaxID=32201 RepID=A0A8T1PZW4_CARIL|nr:hypothetical protein CIPAW_06G020000 [Carya illinoinensis]
MTETKAVVKYSILTVVGFLGMVSFAAGFAAEFTRVKASQVRITRFSGCVYPSSPAMVLGLVAAVALLMAQIIINVSAGCGCCKRSPRSSNSTSTKHVALCVFSWITFVAAFILLLAGAALNNKRDAGESSYSGYYSCYVVKPGVFAGGGQGEISLIPMGQPQFPPKSTQEPVGP